MLLLSKLVMLRLKISAVCQIFSVLHQMFFFLSEFLLVHKLSLCMDQNCVYKPLISDCKLFLLSLEPGVLSPPRKCSILYDKTVKLGGGTLTAFSGVCLFPSTGCASVAVVIVAPALPVITIGCRKKELQQFSKSWHVFKRKTIDYFQLKGFLKGLNF